MRAFVTKNKRQIITIFIDIAVVMIFFGAMLRKGFNADTLTHMYCSDLDYTTNITDARYMIALFDWIFSVVFGARITDFLPLVMVASLLFVSIAIFFLQIIFTPFLKNDNSISTFGANAILMLAFCNVLFIEVLMFGQCCLYLTAGYAITSFGVYFYTKKKYVRACICFLCGVCTYQITIVYAAIALCFFILLDAQFELNMRNILRMIIAAMATCGMGLINLVSIKLLGLFRITDSFRKDMGIGNFTTKMKDMLAAFIDLHKSAYGIMPNLYIPLLYSMFCLGIILLYFLRRKKAVQLTFVLTVYCGSFVLLFTIPMLQGNFNFPCRMAFVFFLIQSMMALIAYSVSENKVRNLLITVTVGYLLINCIYVHFEESNRFMSNALDITNAKMVCREIDKYESKSGNAVKKLATCHDIDSPPHYDEVHYAVHQINDRAIYWTPNPLLRYVSGREYERIEMPNDVFEEYFAERNWDTFDASEQLVFIDDTLYWCVF